MELELFSKIAEYGLLGAMFVLVLLVMHKLWGKLEESWNTRLADNKVILEVITATNANYEALVESNAQRVRATEAIANAVSQIATTMGSQHETLKDMQKKIDEVEYRSRKTGGG